MSKKKQDRNEKPVQEAAGEVKPETEAAVTEPEAPEKEAEAAKAPAEPTELEKALRNSRYTSMDDKVGNLKINRLSPRTYRDSAGFSYRLDGNNVDIETENVALASNQMKYNGLMDCLTQEFKNLQMVMK